MTGPLLWLPLASGDTTCPTCCGVIAAADIDGREATALCRICDRVYPCFHGELHRTDLGGGHEISDVCVSVVGDSPIYSAHCLCSDLTSTINYDRAREWIDEHTVEVAAELAAA